VKVADILQVRSHQVIDIVPALTLTNTIPMPVVRVFLISHTADTEVLVTILALIVESKINVVTTTESVDCLPILLGEAEEVGFLTWLDSGGVCCFHNSVVLKGLTFNFRCKGTAFI
jgi:hypothetical protein